MHLITFYLDRDLYALLFAVTAYNKKTLGVKD